MYKLWDNRKMKICVFFFKPNIAIFYIWGRVE